MILPIVAYGDPVLRKETEEIDANYPDLKQLIADMFETMYHSKGVGLAAPQIGLPIRLFIVDAAGFNEDGEAPELEGFKRVFINPIIIEEKGKEWKFEEGCLSIPGIREEVSRKPELTIEYYNENFELVEEKLDGLGARVVQHEYDHIEGVLFIDKINPLKKQLIKSRLNAITKGEIKVGYRMKFPLLKNKSL
ncbi:MAG: peptide deformylase [Flavobacteriales bacterium]|nr:peptide deformylase [Flavobacteriales bacterium]MCW8913466.1 peptide deformylase [Flavobacteriales bacterium]MCW8937299.1 peptide deformylase [Flavobacteriales bacterium]MCW8940433.1 peptide deformylase [Flavobacteriales bacterium]MCW8967246.1 peptide deformylase [Flavobacteriales bacterium]